MAKVFVDHFYKKGRFIIFFQNFYLYLSFSKWLTTFMILNFTTFYIIAYKANIMYNFSLYYKAGLYIFSYLIFKFPLFFFLISFLDY